MPASIQARPSARLVNREWHIPLTESGETVRNIGTCKRNQCDLWDPATVSVSNTNTSFATKALPQVGTNFNERKLSFFRFTDIAGNYYNPSDASKKFAIRSSQFVFTFSYLLDINLGFATEGDGPVPFNLWLLDAPLYDPLTLNYNNMPTPKGIRFGINPIGATTDIESTVVEKIICSVPDAVLGGGPIPMFGFMVELIGSAATADYQAEAYVTFEHCLTPTTEFI